MCLYGWMELLSDQAATVFYGQLDQTSQPKHAGINRHIHVWYQQNIWAVLVIVVWWLSDELSLFDLILFFIFSKSISCTYIITSINIFYLIYS